MEQGFCYWLFFPLYKQHFCAYTHCVVTRRLFTTDTDATVDAKDHDIIVISCCSWIGIASSAMYSTESGDRPVFKCRWSFAYTRPAYCLFSCTA